MGALIGAYVFFGPSTKKRKRKSTCPGLVNLGNTCFLNAILQALAPCSSVIQWIRDFLANKQDSGKYFASNLIKVLGVLNNDSIEYTEEYCPSDVFEALRARGWVITQDEQDAYEMFQILTQTLDEESTKYRAILPLFDAAELQNESDKQKYQKTSDAINRTHTDLPLLPKTESKYPLKGLLASQLQCMKCQYKYPVKYDSFDSLSLTLPAEYLGPLTLDQLLKKVVTPETVHDVECVGCARELGIDTGKPPKSTFIKKLTIGKLPQCLCLHIQRTVWLNSGVPMKRFDTVSFPEVLSMADYVYNENRDCKSMFLPLNNMSSRTRMYGGHNKNGITKFGSRPSVGVTSPTITMPYSGPVTLLKALNYHNRTSMKGLSVETSVERVEQSNSRVQRLAQAYSTETFSPINTDHVYKLTSTVTHLGGVFSGHFVTYRRMPTQNGQRFPNGWLYTSDTLVKKATVTEVMGTNAYLLFYEKI